jgi:hypothetical protein
LAGLLIQKISRSQTKAMIRCLDMNRSATLFMISLSLVKSRRSPSVSRSSRLRTTFSKWTILISKNALKSHKFISKAVVGQKWILKHS